MSQHTFGVDTAFPPPPPQPPVPGWPPRPPDPPAGSGRQPRRRWPLIAAAGVTGAVVASIAATAITLQTRDSATSAPHTPAPVTVTVAAPAPASPAPLPTALADQTICKEGFLATDAPTQSAKAALDSLPSGVKILDPAVQQNREWASAVRNAGGFYIQASEALQDKMAPGATPVLFEAANTMVKALRILGDSYTTFDPIAGNAREIADEANAQMIVQCTRLAP